MRNLIFIYCSIILLISCSDKNNIPEGVLSPKKMQAVLTDILVADVLNNDRILKDTSLKLPSENASYFLKIFQLHNTTRNEFNRSYNFYLKRPDLLKVITDSVSSDISRRNQNLNK
ncbi:MAG: DUF4296 domain-containing protein, partial [Lacibacter sp.]